MSDRVDVAAARVLCNNATDGPWDTEDGVEGGWAVYSLDYNDSGECPPVIGFEGEQVTEDDARFIAAARTLVPALLDEIERLHEERGRLVKATNQLAQVRLLCHEMNRRGISSGWPFTVTAILELTSDDE